MIFGKYFKELRKSKDKTQEELAGAIGKTKMLISGVETGRNASFSDEDIDKIIPALALTEDEGLKLRIEAAKARDTLPSDIAKYLFKHEDLLMMIGNMADRQIHDGPLDRIIKYAEEILNVKND